MVRVLLLLMLFGPLFSFSQGKLNLTILGGFANYNGELQEKRFTMDQSRPVFGLGLNFKISSHIALHGTLTKGQVKAHDRFSSNERNRARNLFFVSNIYEAALTGNFYLRDLDFSRWSPFVFGGAALFRYNPNGEGGELRLLSTEGQGFVPGRKPYRIIAISLPIGAGLQLRITDNTHISYEIGLRKTFTDYIDDVSKTYVDENVLRENRGQRAVDVAFRGDELDRTAPYPAAGTLRGSPNTKDWYYFSGIRILIGLTNSDGKLFGKTIMNGSVDCPKW